MPQAFTLCRVAAIPIGHAMRGDGTKTGSTMQSNQLLFAQPSFALLDAVFPILHDIRQKHSRNRIRQECAPDSVIGVA